MKPDQLFNMSDDQLIDLTIKTIIKLFYTFLLTKKQQNNG